MAKIKVLITGSPCIGKSHLLQSLKGENTCRYTPTWGVDLHVESHKGHQIYLYDSGGNSKLEKLQARYYDQVDVVALMFSYNHPHSLWVLKDELKKIQKYAPGVSIILVGSQHSSQQKHMPFVIQTYVDEFIATHRITQFLTLDSKKQVGLSSFLDKCLYKHTLTEKVNTIARHSDKYATFWNSSENCLTNIERVFGNYAGLDRNPCLFALLHPKRHFKNEVTAFLNQRGRALEDLMEAKRLVGKLEALAHKKNSSLSRRIAYTKDKISELEARQNLAAESTAQIKKL